jgi:hypothetical protein
VQQMHLILNGLMSWDAYGFEDQQFHSPKSTKVMWMNGGFYVRDNVQG